MTIDFRYSLQKKLNFANAHLKANFEINSEKSRAKRGKIGITVEEHRFMGDKIGAKIRRIFNFKNHFDHHFDLSFFFEEKVLKIKQVVFLL